MYHDPETLPYEEIVSSQPVLNLSHYVAVSFSASDSVCTPLFHLRCMSHVTWPTSLLCLPSVGDDEVLLLKYKRKVHTGQLSASDSVRNLLSMGD